MIPKRERKPSVFSFDGFPNIKLLDQCTSIANLDGQPQNSSQQREAADQEHQQKCQQIQQARQTSSSTTTSLHEENLIDKQIEMNVPTNSDSLATRDKPIIDDIHQSVKPILQSKPIRQDTLGSNGSSRASSCDEPTIALNSTNSSIIASPNSILSPDSSESSSNENLVTINQQQQHIDTFIVDDREGKMNATITALKGTRKDSTGSQITLSAMSDSASLNCSSDSINIVGSSKSDTKNDALETAITNVDTATATSTINHSSKITPPTTPTLVAPPFESIKTQIRKNSIPNAQLVQRHIDNLISQNTAIVDNWNLVSIRSYTSSSRQDQQTNNNTLSSSSILPAASTTVATKPTINTKIITDVSDQTDFTSKEQQSNATSSNSSSKEKLLSFPLTSSTTHLLSPGHSNNKRPKRWSTAMMSQNQLPNFKVENNSSNFGYSKALNNCNYINNNNISDISDNSYLATSSNLCDINKHRHFSTADVDKGLPIQTSTNNFRPLKQSERKRSYNLARLSSPPTSFTFDSLHASGSHLNSPLITPCSSTQSLGGANLTSSSNPSMSTSPSIVQQQQQQQQHQQQQQANNWSFSDQVQGIINKIQFNTATNNHQGENNLCQQYQDPLYIENGIQNLSLRRKESNSEQHHHHHYLNLHSPISDEQLINSQPLLFGYHHHHSPQIDHQQNLIPPINQYHHQLHQQQQQQPQQSSHDQIVMAALIMERHRQSLIAAELHRQQLQKDIENQAAIIRQKQMIEQQLDFQIALSQQLAASLEQYKQSDQQYHQTTLATNNAETKTTTTPLSSKTNTNTLDTNFNVMSRDSSLETNNTSETTLVRQSSLTSNLGILKQQLLDMQEAKIQTIQLPVPHESLPFKKRKISEPNMRY